LEHAPSWKDARAMVAACFDSLPIGGSICVVSPDISSWKSNFWEVDWSHGYPTSLNRVAQLLREVGFKDVRSLHHTFTVTQPLLRAVLDALLWFVPTGMIDFFSSWFVGKKYCFSLMTLLGWRQILCTGKKV
jgi:hypothetical protein